MVKRLFLSLAVVLLAAAMGPGAALACDTCPDYKVNQGAEKFVLPVDNEMVSCPCPKPLGKVEGDYLGHKVFVKAPYGYQIDKVTVKSGKDNEVWGNFWHEGKVGMIYSKKDISNYVVWVCPKQPCGCLN